jgi:Tol biopolymer transport system component
MGERDRRDAMAASLRAVLMVALLVLPSFAGGRVVVAAASPSPDSSTDPSQRPAVATAADRVIEGVTHGSRWLVDVRDLGAMSLPLALRPVYAAGHTVSPDGRQVAFAAPDAEGMSRVYLSALDGMDLRPLTPAGVTAHSPAWSPDGRTIAYVDDEGLGVQDLASGVVRRFERLPTGEIEEPSFRMDGRRILFTRTSGPRGLRSALWTVPAHGGRPRLLLERATAGTWSPDGSRLVFRRRDNEHAIGVLRDKGYLNPFAVDGERGIWIADAHGGEPRRLGEGTAASWAPDSRRLVVVGADRVVRIMEARTGRVSDLACGWSALWWDADHVLVGGYEPDCDSLDAGSR